MSDPKAAKPDLWADDPSMVGKGGASTPATNADDWKIWQQNDAAPEQENGIQRAFDNLTTVTPEQEQGHLWLTNKAQEFGAGAIQGAGTPFVHPLKTIEGIGSAIAHPIDTAKEIGTGAMEHPAQALGNVVGGAVLGGAADAAGAPLLAKIPTRAKGGAMLENVMSKAANEPVDFTNSLPVIERAQQLSSRGGGTVGTIDNLYKRINTVSPMDYREARDWASNLSRIGREANEANVSGPLRAQVKMLPRAFNQDVGAAAYRTGVGPEYEQGMKTYGQAAGLRKALINTGKVGAGAAASGYLAHRILPALVPDR